MCVFGSFNYIACVLLYVFNMLTLLDNVAEIKIKYLNILKIYFSHISKWNRLVKVVALCLKLKEWLKSNRRCKVSKESLYDSVPVIDILDAERDAVAMT